MDDAKQGVVISSGGADGAYSVGVMKALCSGRCPVTGGEPLDPEVFVGTSIGAFNAACLVSSDGDSASAVARLERIWLEDLAAGSRGSGNGAYRFRANPIAYLDPRKIAREPLRSLAELGGDGRFLSGDWIRRAMHFASSSEPIEQRFLELIDLSSFVSTEPLLRVIQRRVCFDRIRRSSKALTVLLTNSVSGELERVTNEGLTDELGAQLLMASAAVPGFFPAVRIDGVPYLDGAVLGYTRLAPAIDAGASTLHVVYPDPDVDKLRLGDVQSTLDTFYQVSVIGWAARVNEGIDSVARVNQQLRLLEELRDEGEVSGAGYERLARALLPPRRRPGSKPRRLILHRYHPSDDLYGPLGLLNLDRRRIEGLIERGFEDTVGHDCEECRCVLR